MIHHSRRRHPCRTLKCRGSKPAPRKTPTLGKIAEKLDNNGKKIDAILENVSDLKNTRSKDEYDYEEYGSGESKLLSKKVDALLENVSDLKTAVYNALNSSNVQEANEEKESSPPSGQTTKNLPHQGIEGPATNHYYDYFL